MDRIQITVGKVGVNLFDKRVVNCPSAYPKDYYY